MTGVSGRTFRAVFSLPPLVALLAAVSGATVVAEDVVSRDALHAALRSVVVVLTDESVAQVELRRVEARPLFAGSERAVRHQLEDL